MTPEQIAQVHTLNPLAWILDNNMINENQKPFEFNKHRFLAQPYMDTHPDQVVMKSAQIGWSVQAILKSIHAANFLKLNVIYVLPTRNVVHEFVTPKVNPLIQRNPAIQALVKKTDSVSLKQIGDRFLYFRGAFHEGEAISTTADLVVSDEYDRSDQQILTVYQSRLQASEWGWQWRFSNPSLPGFGVSELFEDSDQHYWFVKCRNCGHLAYMDFEASPSKAHYINPEKKIFVCGKCGGEITNGDRQSGFWYPKYRGRKRRGYWISQMMCPWVSAEKILQQKEDMPIDVFYNFVLGLPYQASEFMLNRQTILNATQFRSGIDKADVIIGVDNGKVKHWVMGNPEGVFAYGTTEDWADIEILRNTYDATMVIDALPDFTIPEQLSKKYPGRVFVHYYSNENSPGMTISRKKEGEQFGVILSDRTKLSDSMVAAIANKEIMFYQLPTSLEDLIYHCEQCYRVLEPDTKGILKARWETKNNRPDHFFHALNYYKVGLSFAVKTGQQGGILPSSRPGTSSNIKVKRAYDIRNGKASVTGILGNMDDLIERSLRPNRRKRL